MVCKLATRYSCANESAKDELVDFGLLCLQQFLLEHETELTPEIFKTKYFTVKVYNYLWSKIGHEAEKLSRRSPCFENFTLSKKECENESAKSTVQFFGYMAAEEDSDEEIVAGEVFDKEVCDSRIYTDMQESELFLDVKRILTEDEFSLFVKVYNGATLAEIGAACGISAVAVRKRLMKLRKKLKPVYDSIKGVA